MEKRKNYGITQPKSSDYFLAVSFALLGLSALWVAIWATASGNQAGAGKTLELLVNAIAGKLNNPFKWVILAQSIVLWLGILSFISLGLISILRKKYREIAGLFALLLISFIFVWQLGSFAVFVKEEIYGLFYVFLAIFMLTEVLLCAYVIKLEYNVLIKQSKLYNDYKKDFENNKIVHKLETKKEPQISTLKVVENEQNKQDGELIFKNSNEYRDYMYHHQVSQLMNEETLKNEVAKENNDGTENDFMSSKANNYTFEQKLAKAKPVARKYFKELKKYYEELGFKYAITKQGATFSYKNTKYAQITTSGQKGLKIYFKLDAKNYENSTIPVKSVAEVKKYENVPLLFVAKSDLAIKRAKQLMDDVKSKLE